MTALLIVDNAVSHRIYRPVEHWKRSVPAGVPVTSVYALEQDLPDDLGDVTHVILTGSEATICEREPWAEREAVWLRGAVDKGVPILASCWAHQLVAYAFGGPDCIGRAPKPELGWPPIEILDDTDPLLGPEGPQWFAFNSHFDEVPILPDGFVATARSAGCAIHAMRHRTLPVFGLQAHPEINRREGAVFLAAITAHYPQHAGLFARALGGLRRDSKSVGRIVSRLLSM